MSWLSGIVFFLFLFLDLTTKHWALQQGEAMYNTGISFGLGSSLVWWLFVPCLVAVLGLWMRETHLGKQLALAVFCAGGLGNVVSRALWGGIVDWLRLPFLPLKNNIADWCVLFGIVIFLLLQYRHDRVSHSVRR